MSDTLVSALESGSRPEVFGVLSAPREQEPRRGGGSFTHGDVVDRHPHGAVVVDLLRGDGLGLVRQEDAEQQQQTLVAVNHTWRKRKRRGGR
ncbi:hypothetical protein EYF80_057512 [Liparis tanakae]|uniref:Uncharacterized protein n=1 Tax=Liparis tanakae TaxID=230148 RepID=A0A4Z2EUV9_9TELE|nr:hypothetical protein EYF80_057512 [Liparis tanakae]